MDNIKVTRPTEEELNLLGISSWNPWECEVSIFDWQYDQEEWCYLFEGKAKISSSQGDVEIKSGDLVKFSKGLKCKWNVLEKVKKVYTFK